MNDYTLDDFIAEEIAADPSFEASLARAESEVALTIGLARLRESRGFTQRMLATCAGVKQPQIARIERGQAPTTSTLALLARVLGAEFVIGAEGGVRIVPDPNWVWPEDLPERRRKGSRSKRPASVTRGEVSAEPG